MTLYYSHPSSLEHETGGHPENAGRIRAIEAAIERTPPPGLDRREPPRATREQLERVHTPAHLAAIEEFCESGGGMIDMDTIASERSWEAALRTAGAAADAAERLLAGEGTGAFCAQRPPGHHAERDRAMGFCLLNNAAVAAEHAIAAAGAERVLVVDWDVHHGNGTEAIFKASDRVLYSSIHQWPLYPGTGPAEYEGEGAGEGYTVNLPVDPGADSERFLALVQHVITPVAREFAPGLIVISAGYDAHFADPLASCAVDEEGFRHMTASLRDVATELGAPLLVCLEGGYAPDALAASVVATLEALAGSETVPMADPGLVERERARVGRRWALLGAG